MSQLVGSAGIRGKDRMILYNLTLQPSTAIFKAICGNFSGSKQQEIVLAQSSSMELLRLDLSTGKLRSLLRHNVFGVIRSIAPFRLIGSLKGALCSHCQSSQFSVPLYSCLPLCPANHPSDYLVVASDSGKLVILNYDPNKNVLEKVHEETYGKTGCRRIVPGQYLTTDPKGRAVMIGAIEKQRLVYILNRDSLMNLTVSSPLEVHRSSTIIHDIIGIDVGFENPIFACIEVDYSEADQDPTGEAFTNTEKVLTYYELDLGLNHVVRKGSETIDHTSNLLIAIPGGTDGPSGVLVCSENYVTWRNLECVPVRLSIPRRPSSLAVFGRDGPVNGILIVSAAMHKLKSGFFVFAQTEEGDVFKITMEYIMNPDGTSSPVKNLKIKYFDTIPVGTSLCLLKSGFLFVASEFGDHNLYQIEDLGNDEENQIEYESSKMAGQEKPTLVPFRPRPLRNLSLICTLPSLCSLTDAKIIQASEDEPPHIYTLCGKGAGSTFRVVKYGHEVMQLAVSGLPGVPSNVWTVKKAAADEYDSYIVVSFTNATLVLSIGETVEEVTNSAFLTSVPTIIVAQLGEDALAQVYPHGVRFVRSGRRNEWKSSEHKVVTKATCNQRQIVIALSGGEIVYFELDPAGHLNEYQERREFSSEITALSIGNIPEGRQRSRFLAVGCLDNTVRIVSLEADSCLQILSIQALKWTPSSLVLSSKGSDGAGSDGGLYLHIGLVTGILMGATVDSVTGMLSDSRVKYLGTRSVKLAPVKIGDAPAILALSSRPWLSLSHKSVARHVPLIYDFLDYACGFRSEQCPEAIVGIIGNTLRIITVEDVTNTFSQAILPLKYTPRRLTFLKPERKFVVIESEHNTWCKSDLVRRNKLLEATMGDNNVEGEGALENKTAELLPPEQFGNPRAGPGKWGSCIRIVDPDKVETIFLEDLDDNEAAFSVTSCVFQSHSNENFVIVGIAKDVTLMPRSCTEAYINTYRIVDDGQGLELVHKTPIEDVPYALCAFQGKLLVGVGKVLRIYNMGKKRLLRKCENNKFPNCILTIHTQGSRIIVGDVQESFSYAIYKSFDNRIVIFADDNVPRWITCGTMLDYDTICGGDKFGNFFINRLPSDISQEVDEDTTGNRLAYEKGYLQGAPHRITHAAEFYVGETLTSVTNIPMIAGGTEVIIYTTLLGGIAILIPFSLKDDVDFFQALEMQIRARLPPLCGRDHLSYRSYYIPVHNVIDGDLCEMYEQLSVEVKAEIANELERESNEISKKIQDMRNKFIL